MNRSLSTVLFLLFIVMLGAAAAAAPSTKISPALGALLSESPPPDRLELWVYFSGKGVHEAENQAIPETLVSPRALLRRAHVLPAGRLMDYQDLPLDERYVAEVSARVAELRHRSKWLNAVSVIAGPAQAQSLASLPFVEKLDLVMRYRRAAAAAIGPPALSYRGTRGVAREESNAALDYGQSFAQVNLINVPPLHARGNHGEGVLIGVFDNGIRLPDHRAFDFLHPHIVATYDFVDHKTSVVPDNPGTGFGYHGVNTLSVLAGYDPGHLIGPAYQADFLLARTENDSSETPVEEDNWVAAIEWAESLGVQITSTSLGYLTFDAPYTSLTWQDMNGRTAPISRAATIAARKGVVVVNSAGNNGNIADHNTLNAPADADSIITVGAVTPAGTLASFSSRGPTVDGRIKPDVVAQGTDIVSASSNDTAGYTIGQGTSFSCPLVAGVAALLLKDHPGATPMQILTALRETASRAATPDDFFGWGIVNAVAADNYLVATEAVPNAFTLYPNYPNPFNPLTTIRYALPQDAHVTLDIYDVLGRKVRTLVNADQSRRVYEATWDGLNANGAPVASGAYFYRLEARTGSGSATALTRKMVLIH